MTGLRVADAIDMHCHFGPDTLSAVADAHVGKAVSAVDCAHEAAASGYRALVLKSHSFASPSLAAQMQQVVPSLRIFGGICTDYPSGGLNVEAVDAALRLGAKIVWLPTIHSHQDFLNGMVEQTGIKGQGIKVIDDDGQVSAAVKAIADLVRQHHAVLATGHTTAAEHHAVIRECGRHCDILVTHAGDQQAGPHLTADQCQELAELGATIELTALTCDHKKGVESMGIDRMLTMIGKIGAERCTLASDYGWSDALIHPAPALRNFLERLWNAGVSESMLTTMVSGNPARLLHLD